jgi:hypothetical protein
MSDLALACYAVLRLLIPCTADPRISYAELLRRLPARFSYLDFDNPQHRNEVWAALGEIVQGCHTHSPRLPALPAVVVKAEDGRLTYPGSGYYPVAHPGVEDEEEQLVLWGQELAAVRQTQYPPQL